MKKLLLLFLVVFLLVCSCNTSVKEDSVEKWKREILETERAFAEMTQKEGISEAFVTYAAEDVVLLRNNRLIIGKDSLRESFKNSKTGNFGLTWKSDFVDVSLSGDLGYTYGKYVYTVTDSIGNTHATEGIFHTVWKRQPDGSWKFVWD